MVAVYDLRSYWQAPIMVMIVRRSSASTARRADEAWKYRETAIELVFATMFHRANPTPNI